MIISHRHRYIFLKSRKTAGTSIQTALEEHCGPDDLILTGGKITEINEHSKIEEVRKYVGKNIWSSYFKFAFTRNPWDLVISRYYWDQRGVDCSIKGFKKWVKKYLKDGGYLNDLQFRYATINDRIRVDFVGSYEHLQHDFNYICEHVGLGEVRLAKEKFGYRGKEKGYTQFYTKKLAKKIGIAFQKDASLFGYNMEQKINKELILTGIGSRETPCQILSEMQKIGFEIANRGGFIRSGHADGADYAFEKGAKKHCVVYLPWPGFNKKRPIVGHPVIIKQSPELDSYVEKYHPAPQNLGTAGWSFMRRNATQVLGKKLDNPSKAIICWTKDGKDSGGTGQALRIAQEYNIPVINMYFDSFNTCEKVLKELKRKDIV